MSHSPAGEVGIAPPDVPCKNAALTAQGARLTSARKLARAILPNGNILTVRASAVGLPDEISIILDNGRSILVNARDVRILGLDNGGFSVISPRAIVVYDSAGNEISVSPNTLSAADEMMGDLIFSSSGAADQDLTQISQTRSQRAASVHQSLTQAESIKHQAATALGRLLPAFAHS
ncbi:MAG: hypothetical protein BCS36_02015 [Desulfovibrio sp. MES5]|uniref:hypothetical protein n=1 Tax=Desulfovibrio sp. MES5 TaxID=1899016 RepID=UPI000B9C905C|nr:hypothetical protein [Desulfovibrio sp. MES5]OXS28123.1 MAG: hypothetical protein BCS36_02015 [Desulfovibrio sp. MES5]